MAHSGKTMTFATDLVPQEDNIYNLGYDDQRWKIYGDLQPLATKIYNAPLYNSSSGANFYQNFATVTPVDYNALWIAHYRITVTAEGHSDYTEICDVSISGRANTYYAYKIYNSIVTYSIYQHILLESNSASNNLHELGYRMANSYGAADVSKVVKVELLEQINCTITLLDNLKLYTSATPSGYTWRGFNATSNGLQETGDSNDFGYYIASNGFKGKAGSNKVYRYCLFARTGDGTYESFVMQDNTIATTKTVNPHGFVPDGKIYWNGNNTVYNEGTLNISPYQQYHSIDLRYSFNFGNTFLPDYCETYVVYTYNEDDGLLYLDTTQWLAAALPTTADGKIYQRIGSKYYTGTSNYYQGSLLLDNPYYEYKDGDIRSWSATHLSNITGADDLKAIEAISGTSGLLKKTVANTWTLDTNNYVTSSGITSVTIGATSPVQSSTSTAQTGSSASTTISLKDAYGDTKNPYGSKTKNYVLAAPSNANGAPSFRALVAADLPTATTSAYGITKLSNTSSSTEEGLAATPKGVWAAINTLDGNLNSTTPGAGKTLTAFSQTDGKVSATFGNISITKSQVSDFSHTHPWSEITSQPTLTNVAISANVTTNANYPIVFATSNKDTTAAKNEGLQKSGAKFYFNPSTGNVQATTFNGYTLAAASAKGVVTTVDTSANLPTSSAVKTFVEGKGYVTSSGVTSVATGAGLTGGTITGTGTIKAYLKSETKATYNSATVTNTSSRQYAVTPDKTGYLSVNVPWADTHRVIKVNGTQALASNTTALNLIAGSNVSITNGGSGAVTIAATDTKYNAATTSTAGLMSAADKTKLNGIDIRYTENSTAPNNPITGTIWLQKKPSSSANGGNMPNAMFQTVSITIPYNTATYTYSNSWITNETAIVATNLAQIGFRDTYITWTIQTGQIVFTLGSAISRNITFQVAMIK